ncbi:MAG: MBOAT family protein [Bacteroidales bacterium]|nr:MBOAT family protein [Bacteroidales bacterium]
MSFISFTFPAFLAIVFCLYWFVFGRNLRWQNAFVVLASYVFYGWWDWRFLILIAFTTICSWSSGLLIGRFRGEPRKSRAVSVANIVLNLGILALFKYYDFFAQSFADVFLGGHSDGLLLHLILPVGISFYTFQALSYSIDVYRGRIEPVPDVVQFFAYVSFFPQLVAGPIERATNLLPQFGRPRTFDYSQAVDGLRQMLWGYFKKIVVADFCAVYVDDVFAHPQSFSGMQLIVGAFFFAFQIYGDFSGYSDIAIGSAKLFGIRLTQNFRVPYFSRNIAEFWRRWHISLMTWFRDYLYIPLGGNKGSKARVIRNTFIVFLLSGLWHGADWTYVAWGGYNALLFLPLILSGSTRKFRDDIAPGRLLPSWKDCIRMTLTFFMVMLGWILFRSDTLADAADFFIRMWQWGPGAGLDFLLSGSFLIRIVWIAVLVIVEWLNRSASHALALDGVHSRTARYAIYIILVALIMLLSDNTAPNFIYFQF